MVQAVNARGLLRRQLLEAWRTSIERDYGRQRINSERSLQASLWGTLDQLLPETRRMFIEPGLSAGRKTRFPDLVICNTRSVIAIVELKYQPRVVPSWRKDLETFEWVIRSRDEIYVSNSRYRGRAADERVYPLASTVLYVWAGIHRDADVFLGDEVPAANRTSFMEMHAVTAADAAPKIRVGAKWL